MAVTRTPKVPRNLVSLKLSQNTKPKGSYYPVTVNNKFSFKNLHQHSDEPLDNEQVQEEKNEEIKKILYENLNEMLEKYPRNKAQSQMAWIVPKRSNYSGLSTVC